VNTKRLEYHIDTCGKVLSNPTGAFGSHTCGDLSDCGTGGCWHDDAPL